ncbi:MAG: hypothetical protein QNJ74_01610 [Trichodesmium sp. MO_231.B1]|nr:hypothetical protein [Trichodesmium sp. MO_231.B1]
MWGVWGVWGVKDSSQGFSNATKAIILFEAPPEAISSIICGDCYLEERFRLRLS